MHLVVQKTDVGFFSSFNILVASLLDLKKNGIEDIVVYWNNMLYQNEPSNLFDEFFYEQNYSNENLIVHNAISLGAKYYSPILERGIFIELNEILKKYKHFESKGYLTCKNISAHKPNSIGVHIRRTDHYKHSKLLDIEEFFLRIDKKIEEEKYENIFLMTDEQQVVNIFEEKYGNKVYTNEVIRSQDQYPIHYSGFVDRKNLALNVMTDAISLSRCEEIIVTSSNIAGYSLMLSPNIKYDQIDKNNKHY